MGLPTNRVGCAPITIRRIEANNLRPSFQMAELMALALMIPEAEQLGFVRLARQKGPETPIPKPTPSPGEIGMADLTGRSVKGFQLGELIGSGGFGVVYRAVQPSVSRDVAVKIILPRFANQPDFIRRFEAEAQLVARLEHPHIVPLYDYWREPDAAYLIMRLLRGGSLDDKLKTGPLSMVDFQRIIPQISHALHIAHRNGVVHRDIKPANVMLDEDKNAYLTDFGIAKSLDTSDGSKLTQGGALIGSPAYISPEQILAEPVGPASDIYCFGIMLFEILAGEKPFPGPTPVAYIQQHINDRLPSLLNYQSDLPPQLDEIIQRATEKKPEDRYQTTLELLSALEQVWDASDTSSPVQTTTRPELSAQELAALENPYRGLRPFTEADAANFHGRSGLIQELLVMMADGSDLSRFVAVVGPSGSGKSSVVKAGVIPALRRGGLPNSDNWFMVDLTPSTHPWEEVEAALLRVAVNPPDSLLSQLQDGNRGLLRAVRRILPDNDETELLLVIDQFEELFTLVEDEAIRAHFLESLITAVLDPRSRLRLIITLRADFTDRPLQYVDFGELMRQRTAFVLPMAPQELTKAVTNPLAQLNMEMAPDLVATIIREVGDQPGMLPLLQYALTELFEERQGRTLTLADYEATGGALGALARRADDIFNSLDAPAQEATRQLFLRLITLGEGVEDTRRRVLLTEIESLDFGMQNADFGGKHSAFRNPQSALERYGRFRLLTFDHDPMTRSATVEVAHEALLREWPRLRSWLTDSREDVRQQRLLAEAASQWENATQESGYLLRGSRLTAFEAWAETTTIALTGDERSFLEKSVAARDQRHAEEEARRQRELITAQKLANEQTRRAEEQTLRAQEQAQAAQTLRQRALFLTVSSVVAVILAVAAFGFARSSTNNANLASTREAEAVANLNLAVTNEANAVVNANLASTREAEAEVERDRADRERETAVAEAEQRALAEADALESQALAEQQRAIAEEQRLLAVSRELSQVAAAVLEADPELSMILAMEAINNAYSKEADEVLHNGLQQSRIRLTLSNENTALRHAIYTPDGSKLVIEATDTIELWDATSGERLSSAPLVGKLYWRQFNANGDKLMVVTEGEDGEGLKLISWDMNSPEVQEVQTFAVELPLFMEAVLSPDGILLAVGNVDNEAELWDTVTGERLFILTSYSDLAGDYSFNGDGSQLVVGGINGEVTIFDIPASLATGIPQPIISFTNSSDGFLVQAMLSPSGNWLITEQGTTKIWDISNLDEPLLVKEVEGLSVGSINRDETLAIGSGLNSSIITVWELETGESLFTLGHSSPVSNLMFSPDEQRILTSSADGTARIWDASLWSGGEIQTYYDGLAGFDFEISPDQQLIASGSSIGPTTILNRETLEVVQTLSGDGGLPIYRTSFHPDGSRLATVGEDQIIRIWDVESGEVLLSWMGHEPGGSSGGFFVGDLDVSYSPDGSRLATASSDGTAKVWNAETGEQLLILKGHTVGLHSLDYSPDGLMIATGSDNPENTVRVWNAETGAEIYALQVQNRAWGVKFSPDSQLLATAGSGGFITLWNLSTGTEFYSLSSQHGTIGDIEFTPDGTQFVTNGGGNTRLWDVQTGEEIITISTTERLFGMDISADGRFLYGGVDGLIMVFTLNVDDAIALANERLTRNLSEAECQQYLHLEACPVD